MQNSVWKITVWIWVLLYIALTSFSNAYSFSKEQYSQTEQQENAAFNKLDFYTNLAVQSQSVEQLSVPSNFKNTSAYLGFVAVNVQGFFYGIVAQSIHPVIDHDALFYSFSGADLLYPFHSFW